MRFRFFTIPAFDPDTAQDALNAFCAQHRIVASDRHFVDRGVDSFWAVCVTWVEGAAPAFPGQGKRDRVDYREVLGEDDFAVYSELRRLRKQLAEREGVPAYPKPRNAIGFHLASARKQEILTLTKRLSSLRRPHGLWPMRKATRRVSMPCSNTAESPSGRRHSEAA